MNETKQETTATVGTASSQMIVSDVAFGSGGIVAVAGSLILGFLAMRKRLSRDNLELTKDRAETNLIAAYQKTITDLEERNKRLDENAREAWKSRAEDAKRIGELTAKVDHLTETNTSMGQQMALLTETNRLLTESNRTLEAKVNEMSLTLSRALAAVPTTTT